MARWVVGVWLCAFLGACSAESGDAPSSGEEGASEETTSSTSEELMIGTGLGTTTCPGGGSPACVVCKNGCQWSCAGDYKCGTGGGFCWYTEGQCKTVSFAPIFGGGYATFSP
jgi:hypothetical protein